mmetsp:Transcript_141301/g.393815  ORF Transcript_141301/g.393815 Transcript_141301/m.393815 type:complete len:231 (-) Transcript_141301:48-740(-)
MPIPVMFIESPAVAEVHLCLQGHATLASMHRLPPRVSCRGGEIDALAHLAIGAQTHVLRIKDRIRGFRAGMVVQSPHTLIVTTSGLDVLLNDLVNHCSDPHAWNQLRKGRHCASALFDHLLCLVFHGSLDLGVLPKGRSDCNGSPSSRCGVANGFSSAGCCTALSLCSALDVLRLVFQFTLEPPVLAQGGAHCDADPSSLDALEDGPKERHGAGATDCEEPKSLKFEARA